MRSVLTYAGLGVSILGLLAGYIYFRVQRARRGLIYELVSNSPLVMTTPDIGGHLQVVFNDVPVEHAHLMIIRFANSGNVPIQLTDFSGGIRVKLAEQVEILAADVAETNPASLASSVQMAIMSNALSIEPLLLNSRDSFSLRLFVSRAAPDVTVEARIAGVSDVIRQESVAPEDQWTWPKALTVIAAFATAVIGLIPALLQLLGR